MRSEIPRVRRLPPASREMRCLSVAERPLDSVHGAPLAHVANGPTVQRLSHPSILPPRHREGGACRCRLGARGKADKARRPPMAAFNTATAAAVLASPTPCRPSALAARLPAARWAPLRCSPPTLGLRRGTTGPSRRGSAALRVEAKKQTFSSFDELLEKSEKPLLVDFYATWCGPCQYMVPILQEVSEKLSDKIQVVKIDTEKYTSIANRYRIEALPTFIIFKNGKPCHRFEGALPANQLIEQIENVLAVTE